MLHYIKKTSFSGGTVAVDSKSFTAFGGIIQSALNALTGDEPYASEILEDLAAKLHMMAATGSTPKRPAPPPNLDWLQDDLQTAGRKANQAHWDRLDSLSRMDEAIWERFRPITNPTDNSHVFDPREAADAALLAHIDEHHLWTVVEKPSEDGANEEHGQFVLLPGRHEVNREGYVVTVIPWIDSQADLFVICG